MRKEVRNLLSKIPINLERIDKESHQNHGSGDFQCVMDYCFREEFDGNRKENHDRHEDVEQRFVFGGKDTYWEQESWYGIDDEESG